MTPVKKATINDVAETAGVSVSTVSLVLSGKGRISAGTRARVHAAIKKLEFVRNRQAAALRGGQSGVIGLIVRDLTHSFYTEVTAGLTAGLEAQGYMLFLTQGGRQGQHITGCLETLIARGVDGIVIVGAPGENAPRRELAQQHRVPLVFVSRASDQSDTDMIRPDNMQAARLLTEHLVQRGHQRIAWVGGLSSSLIRAERVGGFCATLLQYGLPFHSEWIIECESGQHQAAEAMMNLLHHNPTITAVICHNSTVATGAWFGLMRAGRQSGDEGMTSLFEQQVTLAAFADVEEAQLDDLPLTWATLPAREMGRLAAQRIVQAATGESVAEHHTMLPARLVTRKP